MMPPGFDPATLVGRRRDSGRRRAGTHNERLRGACCGLCNDWPRSCHSPVRAVNTNLVHNGPFGCEKRTTGGDQLGDPREWSRPRPVRTRAVAGPRSARSSFTHQAGRNATGRRAHAQPLARRVSLCQAGREADRARSMRVHARLQAVEPAPPPALRVDGRAPESARACGREYAGEGAAKALATTRSASR